MITTKPIILGPLTMHVCIILFVFKWKAKVGNINSIKMWKSTVFSFKAYSILCTVKGWTKSAGINLSGQIELKLTSQISIVIWFYVNKKCRNTFTLAVCNFNLLLRCMISKTKVKIYIKVLYLSIFTVVHFPQSGQTLRLQKATLWSCGCSADSTTGTLDRGCQFTFKFIISSSVIGRNVDKIVFC